MYHIIFWLFQNWNDALLALLGFFERFPSSSSVIGIGRSCCFPLSTRNHVNAQRRSKDWYTRSSSLGTSLVFVLKLRHGIHMPIAVCGWSPSIVSDYYCPAKVFCSGFRWQDLALPRLTSFTDYLHQRGWFEHPNWPGRIF